MASVLIADDEANVRKLVARLLEIEGHTVLEASDGLEALEMVDKESPDIIVLDMKMPKLDGLGVLKRLADRHGEERVVMLTGATDEENYLRAWGAGADAYVSKPFEPDDLVAAVTQVLNLSTEDLMAQREREVERAKLFRQLDRFFD